MQKTKSEPPKRRIEKAEINALPLVSWEGPVELLETEEAMWTAARSLNGERILGFDTETRPAFRKGESYPPALVQLATASTVFLFRISRIKNLSPLLPVLENPEIVKAGVAIRDDIKELQAVQAFEPRGVEEITDLTRRLGYENRGLRPLAGLLLGGRISKGAQVTNWARSDLSEKQIRYAATDAWISRRLFLKARELAEAS
jgi:ribonuclease D